jgi:glycosyltransferase involved in cell wall biosynthesis
MATHGPLVSIGVPVYNGERFLEATLQSLLAQTFTDFEIIVSDNASTDSTPAICQRYMKMDRRVRYHRYEENVGSAGNLLRVVGLSSAPYFKLANADDLCSPDLLAECMQVLEASPEVVLCYARTVLIDENGGVLRNYEDGLHLRTDDVVRRFRKASEFIRLINVLQGVIRGDAAKQVLGKYGGYEGADQVAVAELTLYGQFHELSTSSFYRRMHAAASSSITGHEKQGYLDPSRKDVEPMYWWRLHYEYLKAVGRGPVPLSDRVRLTGRVIRFGIHVRGNLGRELVGAATTWVRTLMHLGGPG